MNILVLRLSALGDVAMTLPAIYSVARTYPQHRLLVATSAFMARLFVAPPPNVEVLPLSKEETRGIAGTWRLLRRLRRLRLPSDGTPVTVDAVADLHNVLRSWIVDAYFRLSGTPVRMLDKLRHERRGILRDHRRTSRPFVLRYFDVFTRLGVPAEPRFTRLQGLSTLGCLAQLPGTPSLLTADTASPLIGIAPFARFRSKTYSPELMQEVIRQLDDSGARLFLFGARGAEAQTLESWATGCRRVVVVAGRLQLEQELALMAQLDVMLTMDSANMHLASLAGTRVVSFWGGTTTACGFLGYGQSEDDAIAAGLPCQPCTIAGSDRCPLGHMQCVRQPAPEVIVRQLLRLVNNQGMKSNNSLS